MWVGVVHTCLTWDENPSGISNKGFTNDSANDVYNGFAEYDSANNSSAEDSSAEDGSVKDDSDEDDSDEDDLHDENDFDDRDNENW